MAKESINLPDIPSTPIDVEDYVAALFQSSGFFVQRGVVERNPTDILELDSVATNYSTNPPTTVLAEAKSGDWGYNDIFKVAGWMKYLNIQDGGFFVSKVPEDKDLASVQENTKRLNIQVVHISGPDPTAPFAAAGYPSPIHAAALEIWRFTYAIERGLLKYVRKRVKEDEGKEGAKALWKYYHLVNSSIFFKPDDYERLIALYSAFQAHPKLCLGLAREHAGGAFDCTGWEPQNGVIKEAIYRCRHDLLQACMYIEHRARLAILKAIVDLILEGAAPKAALKFQEKVIMTQYDMLPGSAQQAIETLKNDPEVRLYPYFWQTYLWAFGGFYLRDREGQEFEWLSKLTGVSVKHIPRALAVFDIVFPGNDWTTDAYESQVRLVKMIPSPLAGMGVYLRTLLYGTKKLADFGYTDRTTQDLSKWYNAGYATLRDLSGFEPVVLEPEQAAPAAS